MSKQTVKVSKFMSLVLRHDPGRIGIELDEAGWVSVELLLEGMATHGLSVSREELETAVRDNDKQRFSFSEDGTRIRANQGHSVEVELGFERAEPPATLYHGTVARWACAGANRCCWKSTPPPCARAGWNSSARRMACG